MIDGNMPLQGETMMETETVGKVLVEATIESLEDLYSVEQGRLAPESARRVVVADALVDTGASGLSMPKRFIQELRLRPFRQRRALTTTGFAAIQVYSAVRLTIQGRECLCDVSEVPDVCPVLIGQIPLEMLDFVVDMSAHCLTGNPAHGGEDLLELY
jgi:predicted aspartyl protease